VKNQTKSDLAVAELNLAFAKQDLEKYTEGEYPNQLKAAESSITLAQEELLRSEEKLEWSRRLYNENYLSQTELQQDELAASRDKLNLEQAENDLNLLVNYTHRRNIDEFESNVRQAGMALERTKRKASADVVGAEATLRARELEHSRQQDKLEHLATQIEKTKIYAPSDGTVIYATSSGKHRWGNQEPLSEGSNVRERQELIHLPTTNSVKAEINIHETNLEKVGLDMRAAVTIDALPDQVFDGHLATVAPLPDPRSMFMNPDLKVYNASVYLENNGVRLRTGMSCKAEIIIENHANVVYVPVQSVILVKGEPTVYVAKGKSMEQRAVEIGLDNNRWVHIKSGLEAGEHVLLAPPLSSGEVESASAGARTGRAPSPERAAKTASVGPSRGKGKAQTGQVKKDAGDRPRGPGRQGGRPGPGSPSPEQREAMQKYQNASPEEQAKMRQEFQKQMAARMTPEQREAMQKYQNASPEEQAEMRQQYQQQRAPQSR